MKFEQFLNERPHYFNLYGNEMSALDDAFEALSNIKDIRDEKLRNKINSMRVNIKYLIAQLRALN